MMIFWAWQICTSRIIHTIVINVYCIAQITWPSLIRYSQIIHTIVQKDRIIWPSLVQTSWIIRTIVINVQYSLDNLTCAKSYLPDNWQYC